MAVSEGRYGPRKSSQDDVRGRQPLNKPEPFRSSSGMQGLKEFLQFLFFPGGRVSRLGYWMWTLGCIGWKWIAGYIAGWILFDLVGGSKIDAAIANLQPGQKFTIDVASGETVFAVYVLLMGPVLWIGLMMFCKRIHDFNGRPWIRVLIVLIPIFGQLWILYELFLKPGDITDNDYGSPSS